MTGKTQLKFMTVKELSQKLSEANKKNYSYCRRIIALRRQLLTCQRTVRELRQEMSRVSDRAAKDIVEFSQFLKKNGLRNTKKMKLS